MIVLKKIKPMFTSLITTAEKYGEVKTLGGIIDNTKSDTLKEYQRVLAVGDDVRTIKVGDLVCVNPANYAVKKYSKDSTREAMTEHYNQVVAYNFNFIEIGDELCLRLRDSDIDFIVEEYDEVEDPEIAETPQKSSLIIPEKKLILP